MTDGPGAASDVRRAARPTGRGTYGAALGEILRHLCDHGPATIAALAEVSGVSRPTVQRALAELEDTGLAAESAHRPAGFGRPARTWEHGPSTLSVLAIDIRPAETRLRLRRLTGALVIDAEIDHAPLRGAIADGSAGSDLVGAVLQAVSRLLDEHGTTRTDVLETVVGVSGMVDADGVVLLSLLIPELTGVGIADRVRTELGLAAVTVENDMYLRALGEMRIGAAQGISTFLYLTNHDFHRPAVVLDGRPWHGVHRGVGEGEALTRTGVVPAELTHQGLTVPYVEVAGRIDAGDLDAGWLDPFHTRLAAVIAVLAYTVDPEVVLVHGGTTTTGPEALADLEARVARHFLPGTAPRIRAASRGDDLTLGGALALALRAALTRILDAEDPPLPLQRRTPGATP